MKGMMVYVYRAVDRNKSYPSARVDHVTLVGPGVPEIFEPTEEAPAVFLAERADGSYCVRFDLKRRDAFGGAFVWSHDSRFRDISEAPIPIHDAPTS